MKITAAVLDASPNSAPFAQSKPLRFAEVELRAPGPGELLVKIEAAGLCHSDLSVINGDRIRPTPMVLGHEAVATVIETGGESDFKPGDRVVLAFLPACGACVRCASGEGYMCSPGAVANGEGRMLQGGRRLHELDHDIHHHLGVSAFATHAVVDHRSAVKIDADIAPEIAALFGCAVLTGVGAVMNTAQVRPGESVAVFGLGGVGLSAVMGAVAAGAAPVIAIDPIAEKRALALELGARAAVAPDGLAAALAEFAPGGVDAAIESVGSAAVVEAAYGAVRRGGRAIACGLPNPSANLSIKAVSLVGDGKTLTGSYMGSAIPSRDVPRYIKLWREGRLPVEKLLTSVRPMSEINELMDELAAGRAVRQIVIP